MKDFNKMDKEELVIKLESIYNVLSKAIPRSVEFSTQQVPNDRLGQFAAQSGYLEGAIKGILGVIFEERIDK